MEIKRKYKDHASLWKDARKKKIKNKLKNTKANQ
jgi:hypothetical protein